MDTLGNRFPVKFLGYAHWFMSTRISQMNDHYISLYQARYATSIMSKYLKISTFKTNTKFYETNLPYNIIFTKYDESTNDDQIKRLTREFNIHY